MALIQSALLDLHGAWNASDGVDVVRSAVQMMLQELIEAEATAAVGVGQHKRSEALTVQRNGHRPRTPTTAAGGVELAIPKLQEGSYFPSHLEQRRRLDQALFEVVMEATSTGRARGRWTTWSKPSALIPGAPSPRSPGSAVFADRDLAETEFL